MWFAEVELVADHMAEGLYTLHTGLDGVYVPFVHQDIKATNVLLTLNDEGNIKKATIGNFEHVRTNSQDIVPAATDMYAMGVTLLQMMLGPVFQRMDKLKIFEGSHGRIFWGNDQIKKEILQVYAPSLIEWGKHYEHRYKLQRLISLIAELIWPEAYQRLTAEAARAWIIHTNKNNLRKVSKYEKKSKKEKEEEHLEQEKQKEREIEEKAMVDEAEKLAGHCSLRKECKLCLIGVPGTGYGMTNSPRPCTWNDSDSKGTSRCASSSSLRHGKKKKEDGWIRDKEECSS